MFHLTKFKKRYQQFRKAVNFTFFSLEQIVELKFQIEEEMLRNMKLKEKLISLQQHIEKTVRIVSIFAF